MKKMKILLSLMLILSLMLSQYILPKVSIFELIKNTFSVKAEALTLDSYVIDEGEYKGLYWSIYESGLLLIEGYFEQNIFSSEADVPWYLYCGDIFTVEIANGITTIPDYAFCGYYYLEKVSIPESVTSIGKYAFENTRIDSLSIPSNVTSIGSGAFSNCYIYDKTLTIFSTVVEMNQCMLDKNVCIACFENSDAFDYALNNGNFISILGDVSKDKKIFGKIGLKLSWELNVTNYTLIIRNNGSMVSFASDEAPWKKYERYIVNCIIEDGCTNISNNAFNGCSNLERINIPKTVTSVGNNAFDGCVKLVSINTTENVDSIGSYAFSGCISLDSIFLTDRVISIGSHAFYNCKSLKQIYISQGLKNIPDYMLYNCSSLKSISIPDTIQIIGKYSFYGCSSFQEITIPESVIEIGSCAFGRCSSVSELLIPDSVQTEGEAIIYGCSNLEKITIPFVGNYKNSYERFGYLFGFNISNYSGYSGNNYPKYSNSVLVNNSNRDISYWCYIPANLKTVVITNQTAVSHDMFYNCSMIEKVVFSDVTNNIYYSAFYNCDNLNEVIFDGYICNIGSDAFAKCNKLRLVSFNKKQVPVIIPSITNKLKIGENAFYNCYALEQFTIPENFESVENNAFYGCSSLTSIVLPISVNNVGVSAFSNCNNLHSIFFYNSECSIQETSISIYATVYGFENSTAERFADQYGYSFIPIDDAHEHEYKARYNYPNCTEEGIIVYNCIYCSDEYMEYLPAKGHLFNEWYIDSEPTCTQNGCAVYYCQYCWFEYYEDVPSLGHNYGEWQITKSPTCKNEGYYSHVCYNCGDEEFEYIPATGHSYSDWKTIVEPTCSEFGHRVRECKYCKNNLFERIEPTEHKPNEWIIIKEPTCTQTGERESCCEICGEYFWESIDRIDHIDDDSNGLCDRCNRAVNNNYIAAGQCGKNVYWVLSANGELRIYGSGPMYYYENDYSCISDNSDNNPASSSSTTYAVQSTIVNSTQVPISTTESTITATKSDSVIPTEPTRPYERDEDVTVPIDNEIGLTTTTSTKSEGLAIIDKLTTVITEPTRPNEREEATNCWSDYNSGSYLNWSSYKTRIKSVIIEDGIITVPNSAFKDCSNLEFVSLPLSIRLIKDYAFQGCISIETITIPEEVESIGILAFANCNNLSTLNINAKNATFAESYLRGTNIKDLFIGPEVNNMPNNTSVERVIFAEGSTKVWDNAFANNYNLEYIYLPDSIKHIGNRAFNGCGNLVDINLPMSLEYVGYSAFNGVPLLNLDLPKALKYIGDQAFANLGSVTELTVPEDVSFIGFSAFGNNILKEIHYNAINCSSISSFVGNICTERIYIGDKVTKIDSYTFNRIDSLKKIYIPDTVIDIHPLAFSECGNATIVCKDGSYANAYAVQNNMRYILEDLGSAFNIKNGYLSSYDGIAINVVVPTDVTTVGTDAFKGNSKVKSIELPYSISKIYSGAFKGCDELDYVIIPFTVTSIGKDVFSSNTKIYCYNGSYAHRYAIENGIPFDFIIVDFNMAKTLSVDECLTIETKTNIPVASGLPMTFESSDNSVLLVVGATTLKGVSEGHAVIKAVTANGSTVGECSMNVEKANHKHSYSSSMIVNPSCMNPGMIKYECLCGSSYNSEVPALSHTFSYMYNDDATDEKDGTETQICSVCFAVGETRIKIGTRLDVDNLISNAEINVAKAKTVDYKSIVTIKASATDVPSNYYLAIYVNGKQVAKGSNTEVTYEAGQVTSDINYTVKVIDANGIVQKDTSGKDFAKDSKVTVNTSFFAKIIAFFKGLFGMLPTVTIKP